MGGFVIKRWESSSALRAAASQWDDLWRRSDSARPIDQAEFVASSCECFAPGRPLATIVVEQDGAAVAAMPLVVGRRLAMRAGSLTGNAWSPAGNLLLDPECDRSAACAALVDGLKRFAPGLLSFEAVVAARHPWRAFFDTTDTSGHAVVRRHRFRVSCIEIASDWESYLASRSRNLRHQMRAAVRRAEQHGAIELDRYETLAHDEIEPLLQSCFELEASGWKGRSAGAVLSVPRAWDYYLRQARRLAARGQLRVAILRHDAKPIAFEYGWQAKGVYGVLKIGYDEAFARMAPGQLLRFLLLEQLHREHSVGSIDFLGPATPATARWATHEYAVDRALAAVSGVPCKIALALYRRAAPLVRRLRNRSPGGVPRRLAGSATQEPSGADPSCALQPSARE